MSIAQVWYEQAVKNCKARHLARRAEYCAQMEAADLLALNARNAPRVLYIESKAHESHLAATWRSIQANNQWSSQN